MTYSTVQQDLKDRPVPRTTGEAFRACRDYQESKGYNGLTRSEVEYIIGNKPCQAFIAACGPNVTSVRSGGDQIYSFKYKR